MPCDYYLPGEEAAIVNGELSELTRLVCAHCRKLEAAGHGDQITGKLLNWWTRHKKLDDERDEETRKDNKRARVKRAALKKLTAEERKALGI